MVNQETLNPYAPPKSNVHSSPQVTGIEAFPRFSTWWVFLLAIVTLQVYLIYWLCSRSAILNRIFPSKRIPVALVLAAIGLWSACVVVSFLQMAFPDDLALGVTSTVVSWSWTVVWLTWLFKFRNRINQHCGARPHDGYWINGVLTFFFGPVYFQYKLNCLIDGKRNAAAERTTNET